MTNSNPAATGSKALIPLVEQARRWKKRRQAAGESVVLLVHRSGRWARKMRQRLEYFGPVTAESDFGYFDALQRHNEAVTGSNPGSGQGVTLLDLCNKYLAVKEEERDRGELTEAHFANIHRAGKLLIDHFGRNRAVATIGPRDFERLHTIVAAKHRVTTRGREIAIIKSFFNYAYNVELIDKPVRFGAAFKAPGKTARRKARAEAKRKHGPKMFSADELRQMIDAARDPQLKAMLLLAANCGFGNADCARLYVGALDLEAGWIDYPRGKTGIERRCPLWPETVAALTVVLGKRRKAKDPADKDLVFLTKYGNAWLRFTRHGDPTDKDFRVVRRDSIGGAITRLTNKLGIHRERCGLYAIRHGFQTVAEGAGDPAAVQMIMGHADNTMADAYRESVSEKRLQTVVDHVRIWLYPKAAHKDDVA